MNQEQPRSPLPRPLWRKRFWWWAASVALAVLAGLLLALNLRELQRSFHWVDHTEQVLLRANEIEVSALSAESNARDYRVNGESRFLEAFQQAQKNALAGVDELARLVADNPPQVKRLAALRPLLEQRFALLTRLVGIDLANRDGARTLLRGSAPLEQRRGIQDALAQFRSTEVELLSQRQYAAARSETQVFVLAGLTAAIAAAAAIFGAFVGLRERSQARLNRLQMQLEQVSRLNTIGQNAAMLAHEISQPLAASSSYVQAARRFLAGGDPGAVDEVREALDLAVPQIERAGKVLQRLRTFIAGKDGELTVESVGALVEEAIELLTLSRSEAQVANECDWAAVPAVKVDRVQIIQVLINLMRNATQAMEGGKRQVLGCAAGREGSSMVRVSISDTGPGLAPELAPALFEPLASSKKGGMGVGLSICRTIVEAHGGRIWTQPKEGGGTIFHFTVPAAG